MLNSCWYHFVIILFIFFLLRMLAKPKWAWVIQRWPLMHQWEWLHDVVLCNSRGLDKWPSSSCIVCLNSNYFLTICWSVCGFAQTIHSVIWMGLAKNRNSIEISQTARIFKKENPPKRGWEKVSHAHLAAWWALAHLSHLGPLSGEKLGWVFLALSKCGLIPGCVPRFLLVMIYHLV